MEISESIEATHEIKILRHLASQFMLFFSSFEFIWRFCLYNMSWLPNAAAAHKQIAAVHMSTDKLPLRQVRFSNGELPPASPTGLRCPHRCKVCVVTPCPTTSVHISKQVLWPVSVSMLARKQSRKREASKKKATNPQRVPSLDNAPCLSWLTKCNSLPGRPVAL